MLGWLIFHIAISLAAGVAILRRDKAADRAILRQDALAMDIAASVGMYSMVLKHSMALTFAGTWTCRTVDGEETGHANCTLELKDDWFLLSGDWSHGKYQWFARLEKVEGF